VIADDPVSETVPPRVALVDITLVAVPVITVGLLSGAATVAVIVAAVKDPDVKEIV
jgi:hypothetical protein